MPDVNSFAPISPTPWGHLNDASNPEATEEPKAPAQQVDFDSFDDWNVDNASGDELGDLQNYGDYLRGKHAEKNQATVGFEQDLRNTLYGAAIQRGLVNPEDGDEVNTAKLFPAPELSTDASLKLISESPSAEITAIAANNLDALPEGTSPEDVHQDILTYRAKQKAFANSMATDPEATESNQEIQDDLEFWKSKAEGYTTGKIYDRAVKSALLDGRVAAARITREDGSSYVQIGKAASGKNAKEIIDLGKDYGVTLQDAPHITKQLETPEGFRHQTFDIIRKQEVGDVVDSILESDSTTTSQQEFDRFVKLYKSYDEAVIDDDKENVQRLEKLLDNETLSIYSTMSSMDPTLGSMDMELDEFRTILTQRAGDQLLGSGQFKLQDDPTKMGMNIKKYGYGPAQMHRSLVSNVAKFEQSINANTDLTEADKVQLRANREAMSAQNFDSANELLSKGADAEEWLGTLQEGRAAGTKDHVILEGFLADPDNYSQFEARAKGVGAAWGQGFVSMVTAPMAMAGNEWAREQLIEANQRNAQRRERARLFGVEFGVGQDVMETIGPVFADMAATAALTATTGAGGVMLLAAKQGAKLSAKNLTKGIVKSMTFNSPFKRLVVDGVEESSEVALERLVKDGYILEPATAEIKKGAMGAIDSFAKIASSKWTQEAAINIPAFSRSAGANYAATYDTLTQMNPDMSHEEKHDRSLGSGLVSGFSTIGIMKGFRSIGRGGIEDAFIKGMTKREAQGVMERLGNMGSRVKLGSEDSTKILGNAIGKIHKDMAKGVGRFAGQKNIVSEAFDGFTSEALEEGLDEFVNSYITDYYTDQSTDGMARLESAYRAALTGGIIGSGMGAYQKLAGRSGLREQSRRDQARLELDFVDNVVAELDTADAPITGQVVRDILTGPARGKRADEARAKLTQELDPNATPKVTEEAASAEEGAPSEPAPFVPTPLGGPAAQKAREDELREELKGIEELAKEQTFLTSDQLQRKKEIEATLKPNADAPQADTTTPAPKDPRSESQKLSHDTDKLTTLPLNSWFTPEGSDSAQLNEEQQARYDFLVEEEMTDDQYKLFEEVDPADTSGLFRSLQIAEAIVDGTLTKDEDGNIVGFPESNDGTLDEVGTRKRMADWLNQEGEGALAGRLTPEEAEENLLKGPDADYMLDVENYVIGVRDPATGDWVGTQIMSELVEATIDDMDANTNPESVPRNLEEVQLELFEKEQIEEKVIVKSAPILDNLTEEESQVVQQELNLGDGTSVRGADIDALAPVTPEEIEEAAEQGVDLEEVNEQMLINLDKEGRVVESEEDADIPMEAGTAEAPVTEVLEFLDTEEDQASFDTLVASGFPSRVTAKTKSGFKYSKKTKGYYPRVSTEVARQIYDTWPVTPTTKPEGGKVFEGRKQVHYNPHTKKMSSSKGAPVKGFLDASGRGVFDNDPVLTAEYLKAGVVVIVPEGITVNPAILKGMDPDTRRVLRVLSVNNENEGMLQDGADPDKVTSTQANYNTVLKKSAGAGLFDQSFYETPLEIDEAPQANGTKSKVKDGEVFTVGDFINNVTTFISNAMSSDPEKGSSRGTLKNLLNRKGVAPLEGDFFDAASQRFVVETMLVANAYVARKNILDGPVGQLLTAKLNKDGTIEVDQEGKPTGNLQLRQDTATNRSKLIQAFVEQTRHRKLTGAKLNEQLEQVSSMTSGSSFPKRTANFVLQEIVNHPLLRENTMPPMSFIAQLSSDNFRKQQKAKKDRDTQNNAERSQLNEDTDTSIAAVSTDPLSRDEANNAIDQDSDVAESLYESEEARSVLVELATELAGGSKDAADVISRMDTKELFEQIQLALDQNVSSKNLQTILGSLESSNPDLYRVMTEGFNVARTGTPQQNKDHNTNARNVVKKNHSRSRIAEAQRKIARAANQAEAERLGLVSGDVNSVVSALQKIAETGTTAHKLVANLILENMELVRDVKFTIISANLPFAGMQTTMTDGSLEVVLNLDGHNGRGLSNVLLEEYVHATLTKILSQPRSSLTPAQLAAVTRLDALRQEISEAASAAGYRANSALMDSLVNMDEFVAGVMLSPELQAEIKGLGADKGGRGFFRKIMDSILKFFGKGVATKEASTYADALTDVIDLAQSTVSVSDPRAKTRAKRVVAEVTANMKATSDAFKATGVPAVYSDPSLDQEQQDVGLTEEGALELTDVDTDTEGVTNPAEIEEAKQKAEALLRVVRELVPPEVSLEIDRTINAVAEVRGGVVFVNPAFIMNLTQDLGLTSSKLLVAKVMSHELSHIASFNTLTQEEIVEMSDTLPDYKYEEIIESYYSDQPEKAAEALALIRATDLDEKGQADLLNLKEKLTEEHLRMRMEILTSGFTTEQDWAFYRTNPSLMKIMFRYASGYFRRMTEMRKFQKELNNGEGNRFMDSAINSLIHELRSIKAGYRTQESSIAFDPTRPDQGFAVLADKLEEGLTTDPEEFLTRSDGLQSAIAKPNQYDEQFMGEALMSGAVRGDLERMPQSVRNALKRQEYLGFDSATEAFANIIQDDNWNETWEITSPSDQGIINRYRNKIYGQTAGDVRFRRSLGLQSAIAPSEGFTPDKMDYSGFIDQLELPFYATGGYDAPTSLIGRILKGALDPRIERMIQNRQFFRNAAEKTANSFKTKFDRLMKEAYGDQLDSSDTDRLNKAIGRSAVVPRGRRKEIEEEYQAELDTIAQTTYESTKEMKLDEQIAADNKFGKLLAEKQVIAKQIIAEQTQALAELEEVSPELAQTIRDIRTELIEPIQEKMKDLYGMDEGMKAHFDVQKGIYLTTQYRMFTETGFHEHASKSPEYAGIREEAGKYFIKELKLKRKDELREQAKIAGLVFNPQEADLIVEAEFQEQSPDSLKTMGQLEVDKFLAQYKRAGKNDVVSNDDAKILEDNLKEKKDLDPRLRALLGEVGAEATVDNLVRTFLTVSTMAANQAMFSNIQKMGQKEGFLMTAKQLKAARKKDPEAYEDWDAVTPKKTSANNPLRGMYAPKHVREGLVELFKSDINTETDTDSEKVVGFMTSTLRQASGLSMATKTLGSIGFYIRNMLSNMVFFGPSQGFVNGASMIAKTKYVWKELRDPNRMDAYLTELSALGVIDNEIRSTLMKDMLNGTRSLSDVISEQNKLIQSAAKGTEATFGKIYKVATRMAGAVDGFYKIAYYENELKVLRKARAKAEKEGSSFANYSDSDLKQMARDKVLMTAQSSSQAPPIVKDIASHGIGALVAPFIRFKAEVPRVVFNTFKLAGQEIKSDSSVIRARGFQRMVGMLAVGGGSMGVVAAILASLADTDDEDMQDFQRETAPEYLRGNSFLSIPPKWNKFLGGGDKYKTIDLTFINPYALLADPVVRAFEKMGRGEFGEAGAALVNGLFVDQYLDEQIAAGALTAVIENRDPTNNKPIVENVSDTTGEAAIKRLTFLFNEAYSPDVLKRAIKAYQTATSDEVYTDPENSVQNILYGAFRPFKVHTIDPERQLKNYLYESRREFANIKSRKNILRSLKPISEQSIVEIFEEEYEDRQAVSNHAIRMMRGASKYGMSDKHIYQTTSEVLAKRRTKNLMNGVMDGINLTPDFTQRMMATAKTEEEKQMKLARIKEAYKWINANPKKYLLSEGSLLKRKKTQ